VRVKFGGMKMNNILIYGCGGNGKFLFDKVHNSDNILAFIDKNVKLTEYCGIAVKRPESILEYKFDLILISLNDYDEAKKIENAVIEKGVPKEKVKLVCYNPNYIELFSDQRTSFIRGMASWMRQNDIRGNVAECGVFRGDSAKFINRYFADRKLYLFDTFEGFNVGDLKWEKNNISDGFRSDVFDENIFRDTSLDLIMDKMTYPENIIIKKGYFPDSAQGIEDRFCFVNLDMDLYTPMLAALRFFWEKMEMGGCMLLHDYFHTGLQGVKKAVEDFESELGVRLTKFPIGDGCSLAILK
jgi:hypothetical protein